jgi:hypothetical protein
MSAFSAPMQHPMLRSASSFSMGNLYHAWTHARSMMQSHACSKAHHKILSIMGLYVYAIQHFFLLLP